MKITIDIDDDDLAVITKTILEYNRERRLEKIENIKKQILKSFFTKSNRKNLLKKGAIVSNLII